ncbi:MAG: DUF4091 domain-containing protein [Clostridia bacterium]|nr:DUF4091 domain-containing protein [Clostridia bacterium]
MCLESRILTHLDKVFLDEAPGECSGCFQGFENEKIDFQLAFRTGEAYRCEVQLAIHSPIEQYLTVRQVRHVPVAFPIYADAAEDCLRTEPGLYPDLLSPLRPHALHAGSTWSCLWLRVDPRGEVPPGVYPADITLSSDPMHLRHTRSVQIEILPGRLPEQTLIHTKWFHCDGLAQYYGVDVFSERHWQLIENQIACAVDNGINMMLMPVHTPPLDTREGGERLTTQLVNITVSDGEYRFDMQNVRRWIRMCRRCGVKYHEVAHLFTQWGARHAPKIIARMDGAPKCIFGWDTDAAGEEYGRFLKCYIPALRRVFEEEGIADAVYWHISDEPSHKHLEHYRKARAQVDALLQGCRIMDALSEYSFYEQGLVPMPIPANDAIGPFLQHQVSGLWTYYCCAQARKVSNMFIAFPSYRNRILGVQLFKYRIAGFLQWGFNFYNSEYSDYAIDPYCTTDADGWVPAGDPFQVYPGRDGYPEESIRLAVTMQALQDLRACQLLAQLTSHEHVVSLIDGTPQGPVTFSDYPRNNDYLLQLRRRVNEEILRRQSGD